MPVTDEGSSALAEIGEKGSLEDAEELAT